MKINNLVKSLIILVVVLLGEVYLTGIIDNKFSVDPAKMIFNIPQIEEKMVQHQRDARYLPYRLRVLVFNQSVYLWQFLRNIANFISFNNINQTILLANVYPVYLGIKVLSRQKRNWWWLVGIGAGLAVIGVNKMVDAMAATLIWLPVMIYLGYRGINKINWRWYGVLLIISFLLRN